MVLNILWKWYIESSLEHSRDGGALGRIQHKRETNAMPAYAFEHEGRQYTPDGRITVPSTDDHNKQVEAAEIERIKTHPERLFLYVKHPANVPADCYHKDVAITTWLGTKVSETCVLGRRRQVGFGMHTYRRAVDCRIFGVRYVGWYMESSGNYCRLRKAKQQ